MNTLTRPLAEDTRANHRSNFTHPLDRPEYKPPLSVFDRLYPKRHNEMPVERFHGKR